MFTALSIGQMARHLPSAGGMYIYIARGLGSKLGFLAGWGFAGAYPLVVPMVSVLFGSTLQAHFGLSYNVWWVIGAVVCVAAVGGLNYVGVQVSARFGLIFGFFEILVMVALSLTLIVAAGSRNTFEVFHHALRDGPRLQGHVRVRGRVGLRDPGVYRLRRGSGSAPRTSRCSSPTPEAWCSRCGSAISTRR